MKLKCQILTNNFYISNQVFPKNMELGHSSHHQAIQLASNMNYQGFVLVHSPQDETDVDLPGKNSSTGILKRKEKD